TDPRATAERVLTARGRLAAWLAGTDHELLRLTSADLTLDPLSDESAASFTRAQRLQWRLTWLQATGLWRGVERRQYKLIPPATAAAVTIDASGLVLATNNGTVTIPATDEQLGTQHVALQGHALAKPGNTITWAVDRLRAFAWF